MSIRTLTTHICPETFLTVIRALADVGAVYTALNLETQEVTIIFPKGVEMMELDGPIPRKLYRTKNGTVFAWVDAYEGISEHLGLSSQRAWDINVARMGAKS